MTPPNEKEDEPEVQWNENALRMAIRKGRSLWRSHNGNTEYFFGVGSIKKIKIKKIKNKT